MSSNLKVNTILPSAGTTIGIGTAGGSITITNGRLGVGTDTPLQRLHIRGEGEGNHLLYLQGGDTICDIVQSDNGGSTRLRSANGSFYVWTGGDGNSSTGANGSPAIHVNTSLETKFYNTIKIPDRIQQDGYTHTAIRFPAAHTITFETDQNERLRITPTGTVGIGVTNPDAKLEVRDSASTGIIVRSDNTQTTDSNKALRVRNNSDTNTFSVSHKGLLEIKRGELGTYLKVGGDDASNGRALTFTSSNTASNGALHTLEAISGNGAIALATAGSEKFRVNKDGTVTKPLQPYVRIVGITNQTGSGLATDGTGTTQGDISYSSGKVTAQVEGDYLITYATISDSGTGRVDGRIRVNGNIIVQMLTSNNGTGYRQKSASIVYHLNVNDYVEWENDDWYSASNTGTTWRTASVYMLG